MRLPAEDASHGLFTHFRHRLGKDGYEKVFSILLSQLMKDGVVKGEVVAVDSTAVKAYSHACMHAFLMFKKFAVYAIYSKNVKAKGGRFCPLSGRLLIRLWRRSYFQKKVRANHSR